MEIRSKVIVQSQINQYSASHKESLFNCMRCLLFFAMKFLLLMAVTSGLLLIWLVKMVSFSSLAEICLIKVKLIKKAL